MPGTVIHPLELMPPIEMMHQFASDYRLSDDALFALARFLIKYRPKTILETGPGLSTYVMLKYLDLVAKPENAFEYQFLSLNHDSEWDKTIKKLLFPGSQFRRWKNVIQAYQLNSNGWYGYGFQPADLGKRDFVLLDGPCDSGARNCDDAQKLYRAVVDVGQTVVMVDDTHRPAEKFLVEYLRSLGYWKVESVRDSLYTSRVTSILIP
jgi:hypothetical protein